MIHTIIPSLENPPPIVQPPRLSVGSSQSHQGLACIRQLPCYCWPLPCHWSYPTLHPMCRMSTFYILLFHSVFPSSASPSQG
ncbi:hypothetical protein I7I53_05810 [Histoplasma capsulatum var. duboisii H88]|uniref:Uncharacterized protein n=1 Tax=Ajellomyces capsulatus (strain H88) TaxID=544711 RepID=A0A8A1LTV4_AJEC8|nr:hypothetical protein I7I53_05810 [Histoplasma capsulatum var. duboisii H88]